MPESLRVRWISIWGCVSLVFAALPATAAVVEGERKTWHRVTLRFVGPAHDEADSSPNPFLDYRLQCAFTGPSGQRYDVPGFFDADGASGSTGALWRCRFAPDEPGTWDYTASFRLGSDVAVSLDPAAGAPTSFDGDSGSFVVAPSDKTGNDFRSPNRGRLTYAGGHYFAFLGSGERWIKGGPNIPENLLGYSGFDNTPDAGHSFSAHVGDWRPGDPDWNGGAGRGLIGALNYLADTGVNSVYFLPMNVGGDGRDTFPTVAEQDKTHYDTSKLRQWETVFTHASSRGIFLHVQLAETESANERYHDNGTLGVERKLYYRELVARFGHHPGLQWNLGEENDYSTANRKAFAAHLKSLDPYDHPVTNHSRTNQLETTYAPLLGDPSFDATSFQVLDGYFSGGDVIEEWRGRSAQSGHPWVISLDEPQNIRNDPGDPQRGHPFGRTFYMWATYLSGGGGFEWYLQDANGGHTFDQRIDDFRDIDGPLRWTGHALRFLDATPFWLMTPRADLASSSAGGKTFVLARPGDSYALYHADGGSLSLDLGGDTGTFAIRWFDPETGIWSDGGSVSAGGVRSIGAAPFPGDAAVLLTRAGGGGGSPPVASFTATPLQGEAPHSVSFDASSSVDDGAIQGFAWSFGDGATASGVTAQHTYTGAGNFVATLTVTDDEGLVSTASQAIGVSDPEPTPPSPYTLWVSTSPDRSGAVPLEGAALVGDVYIHMLPNTGVDEAHFSLDGTFMQIERLIPYDFRGGSLAAANPFDTTTQSDGAHHIEVSVTLDGGGVAIVEAWFDVANDGATGLPPSAVASATPRSGEAPLPVSFDGSGSSDDGAILSYAWTFGDGSTGSGVAPQHSYGAPGRYTATLTVTDDEGLTGSSSISIDVDAASPPPPPPSSPYALLVSEHPDRSAAVPLAGATLTGDVYVYAFPNTGISEARFFLDGALTQHERLVPYDFRGGSLAAANPFDTESVVAGSHEIRVEITRDDGSVVVVSAVFDVGTPTHRFWVSGDRDRDPATPLAGATLTGSTAYVFLVPAAPVDRVEFYIDNPSRAGGPDQTERFTPYDLAGGSVSTANPSDLADLGSGSHRVDADLYLSDGSVDSATVFFDVAP